jgi:hypothetical protein
MPLHAMIDLETLDTKPSCTVLTLGAVKFDPYSDAEPHSEIYMKFDIDEQDRLGRTVTDSTLDWWSKQSQEARDAAFDPNGRISLEEGLDQLSRWAHNVDIIWGQGYGFDITILEDMLRQIGKPIPWQFYKIMDSRTLFKLVDVDPRKAMQTNEHNALADAYFQAKGVQIAFDKLGVKKGIT